MFVYTSKSLDVWKQRKLPASCFSLKWVCFKWAGAYSSPDPFFGLFAFYSTLFTICLCLTAHICKVEGICQCEQLVQCLGLALFQWRLSITPRGLWNSRTISLSPRGHTSLTKCIYMYLHLEQLGPKLLSSWQVVSISLNVFFLPSVLCTKSSRDQVNEPMPLFPLVSRIIRAINSSDT